MRKQITSLLVAASLMLPSAALVSCGGEAQPELSKVDHVYKSTDITLPEEISINRLYPTLDGVLAEGYERSPSGDDYEYNALLMKISRDGSYEKLPVELEENNYLSSIAPAPDGGLLGVIYRYDAETDSQNYALCRYSDGHFETICPDIVSVLSQDNNSPYFYINTLLTDAEGRIYISSDEQIYVLDGDMKLLFTLEINGYINSMGSTSDGRIWAKYDDFSGNYETVLSFIDPDKRDFGERLEIPDSNLFRNAELYIGPGYDLYLDTDTALYGYNLSDESGEPVELLNWINSDIIHNGINSMVVLDSDTVLASYYEYDSSSESSINELYLLNRLSEDEIPERYIINLAVQYMDYSLPSKVVRFNRNNDKYRVVITDWSEYNTSDDYELGETTLQNEILAGNSPDVFALSNFNRRSEWISSGMFTDLYKLMEQDEQFDASAFFPNLLTEFESGGKLYELVSRFYIKTIMSKREFVPYDGWTAGEFIDFAASLPEDAYLFDYSMPGDMFDFLLSGSMDSLIDYEKGSCNFDSDEFRKILEFAYNNNDEWSYASSLSGDELMDYNQDRNKPYREGKILLNDCYIHDIGNYLSELVGMGAEDAVFVGYPADHGNGSVLYPTESYAISEKSPVKAGAWEFVKFIVGSDDSDLYRSWGFSSMISRFDAEAEQMLDQHFFFQYNGGYSSWSGDREDNYLEDRTDGVLRDVTTADIEAIETLIMGAQAGLDTESKVLEIIGEEAEMYFAGDKTLDETAKVIQSRVGIYIAENN